MFQAIQMTIESPFEASAKFVTDHRVAQARTVSILATHRWFACVPVMLGPVLQSPVCSVTPGAMAAVAVAVVGRPSLLMTITVVCSN